MLRAVESPFLFKAAQPCRILGGDGRRDWTWTLPLVCLSAVLHSAQVALLQRLDHLINKYSDELSLVLKDNCDQLCFLTSFTNYSLPLAVRQEYSQNCSGDDGHSKTFLFLLRISIFLERRKNKIHRKYFRENKFKFIYFILLQISGFPVYNLDKIDKAN